MTIKMWTRIGKWKIIMRKCNGGIKMAVSKATLGCVKGEVGTRLIADIKSTSINKEAILKCESLIRILVRREKK